MTERRLRRLVAARRLGAALVCSGFLAIAPAAAQTGEAGQVELGVFGSYTHYDQAHLGFASRLGAGGRLAFHFTRFLSVEASGDYALTNDTAGVRGHVGIARVAGSLIGHVRAGGGNTVYAGVGYQRAFYHGAHVGDETGAHLLLGDRLPLGARVAFRLEGRLGYYPSSTLLGPTNQVVTNFWMDAGLSVFAFGGPPRDADGDGVPDKHDRCAATPRGAVVNRAGCPTDSDHDGILDGLDQCPGTPAGAVVNGAGCPLDTDKDGVFDGIDVCPQTPAGAHVDDNGCPTDADKDGVFDGLDRCAATPAGAKVDPTGCPIDSDKDGVFDGLDQCANTPAGTPVDAHGCPVNVDEDGDGVPDARDRCPHTRPGTTVDAVGCPVLFRVEEGRRRPLILKNVNFETGRATLTAASYATLDQVAGSLLANPSVRIEIGGYTDATGSRKRNQELSLSRALAVRAYLAKKGVSPDRMVAKGYGPARPIATNRTAAGRAQNRRVEITQLSSH